MSPLGTASARVELIPTWRAFTVPEVLSPTECRAFRARAEAVGFSEAPIQGLRGAERRAEVRNNDRVLLDDPSLAALLWSRLQPHFSAEPGVVPVGLNERVRVYRYRPGQFFAPHRDGHYRRPGTRDQSIYTVLLYLNDDYTGGETAFVQGDVRHRPVAGSALCFVHPLVHEGVPVRSGRKYVLRTDVMYRIDGLR